MNRFDLMDRALSVRVSGLVCEFGVGSGESTRFIASRVDCLHGFDSFEGLPERWRYGYDKGHFATTPPVVPTNVHLHVGMFETALPAWLADNPEPIGFVHIDCDLYSSTKTVLGLIGARLARGAVLLFDELVGYPGWMNGEFRALCEWLGSSGKQVAPVGYVPGGEQVALRMCA